MARAGAGASEGLEEKPDFEKRVHKAASRGDDDDDAGADEMAEALSALRDDDGGDDCGGSEPGELGAMPVEDRYDKDGEPCDDGPAPVLPWTAAYGTGFAYVPTAADWDTVTKEYPAPDPWDNPHDWRVNDAFTAGCCTDGASSERWKEVLGEVSPWVQRLMDDNAYTFRPTARPELSRPNYIMKPREQHAFDREAVKCLGWRVIRLWTGDAPPIWISPMGCVPKKNLDPETGMPELRLVFDMKNTGNDHLVLQKQRFESLRSLPTVARRGFKAATLDARKGYWTITAKADGLLGAKIRLRPAWIAAARAAATARMGAEATEAEITHEDWSTVDTKESETESTQGTWVMRIVHWTVLPMGAKISGAVYVTIMRQLVRKWRRNGRLLLHFVDDLLLLAETDEELLSLVSEVVGDMHALQMPLGFEKSFLGYIDEDGVYRGHDVVEWLGMILDFKKGRIYMKLKKLKELRNLVATTHKDLRRGERPQFITLARICGRIIANQAGLHPARLMTRNMFASMTCRTAAEYKDLVAVADTEIVTREVVFWAENLVTFAHLGSPMFPDQKPYTIETTVDAGPEGWGTKTRLFDAAGVVESQFSLGDAFHVDDSEAAQVVRELRGIEQALHEAVRSGKVNLRDRQVVLRTTREEVAVWAQYGVRRYFERGTENIQLITDCEPARSYLVKASGRSRKLQEIAVRIWSLLLQHGASLRTLWVKGERMVALGVDGLSRQNWAPDTSWRMQRTPRRALVQLMRARGWAAKGEAVQFFGPGSVRNGVASAWTFWSESEAHVLGRVAVVRPGAARRQFVTSAMQRGLRVVLLLPLWHGPEYGAVLRAAAWRHPLGRACDTFSSSDGKLPGWLMFAVACDFSQGGVKGV